MLDLEYLEIELKNLQQKKEKIIINKYGDSKVKDINKRIKKIKRKIKEQKELQEINFEDIIFDAGIVTCNKSRKRIQFIFDEIPAEDIVDILINTGFKESTDKKIWERFIKKNSIYAMKYVLYVLKNRKQI